MRQFLVFSLGVLISTGSALAATPVRVVIHSPANVSVETITIGDTYTFTPEVQIRQAYTPRPITHTQKQKMERYRFFLNQMRTPELKKYLTRVNTIKRTNPRETFVPYQDQDTFSRSRVSAPWHPHYRPTLTPAQEAARKQLLHNSWKRKLLSQ